MAVCRRAVSSLSPADGVFSRCLCVVGRNSIRSCTIKATVITNVKRSPRLYLTYYTTEHWGDCKSMHKIVIGDRGTTATERDRGCCTLIFSKCQASHHSRMAVAHYGLRFVSRWLANNRRRRLPPSVGHPAKMILY